jgi:hypothetical protein
VFKLQAVDTELVPKASLIGTFQHPGPESAVDLQRRLKNSLSDRLVEHRPPFLRVLCVLRGDALA